MYKPDIAQVQHTSQASLWEAGIRTVILLRARDGLFVCLLSTNPYAKNLLHKWLVFWAYIEIMHSYILPFHFLWNMNVNYMHIKPSFTIC